MTAQPPPIDERDDKEPFQGRVTSCTHPKLGKPRTRVKRPLHTYQVMIRLRRRASPKELFAPKGIRTLDLMKTPQRSKPLPLEPIPWGEKTFYTL